MSVSLSTRGRRMPPANTRSIARPYLYGLLASTLAMALAACKSEGLSAAPSEPVVTVQAVATQSLAVEQSLPGRTVAYMISERSEEHTSELQSLMRISYAVFCLKKKKNQQQL